MKDTKPLQIPVEPPVRILHTAIDIRSTSLAVLALLAIIGFLFLARAVFIPIAIALVASYALTPIVTWLKVKAKLPKAAGAGLTLAILLSCLGVGLNSLQPEAIHILEIVPRAAAKFKTAVQRTALEPPGAVEKMKKAASEIDEAANVAATTVSTPRVRAPVTGAPAFAVREYIVMGTTSAIGGIGQLVVVVALAYFLLVAGENFRRTLVRISGDTLSEKKLTVQILDEIDSQIQRYLLVQLATSALLGLVTWAVFVWMARQCSVLGLRWRRAASCSLCWARRVYFCCHPSSVHAV